MSDRLAQAASNAAEVDFGRFETKTEFMQIEETKVATLEIGTLTNAIHPLFEERQWENLPDGGYENIQQSARLASKFLESGTLDKFFHTIFFAPAAESMVLLPGKTKRTRLLHFKAADVDPTRDVTPNQITEMKVRLGEVIKHTTFRIDSKIKNGVRTEADPKWKTDNAKYPNGVKSEVLIGKNKYDHLCNAVAADSDTPWRLVAQFDFAVMLLHELGHACDYFVRGCKGWQPFFGNQIHNELGFEMEHHLFGGMITPMFDEADIQRYRHSGGKSGLSGVVGIWEYPYQVQIQQYIKDKLVVAKEEPKIKRPLDIAWRVPMSFFTRFFDEAFWKRADSKSTAAFRPKRTHGFCFRAEERVLSGRWPAIVSVPVRIGDDDVAKELREMYVPRGYTLEETGDIILAGFKRKSTPPAPKKRPRSSSSPEKEPKRLRKGSVSPEDESMSVSDHSSSDGDSMDLSK